MDLLDRQWFLLNALTAPNGADFNGIMWRAGYKNFKALAIDLSILKEAGVLSWVRFNADDRTVRAGIPEEGHKALRVWRRNQVEEWCSASSYSG